jgi:hypothetical protein
MACEMWFFVRLCFDVIRQYPLLELGLLKLVFASYALREIGRPGTDDRIYLTPNDTASARG